MEPFDNSELHKEIETYKLSNHIANLVKDITRLQSSIDNMALRNNRCKAINLRNNMIVDVPIVQSLIDHKKVELILLGTNYEYEITHRK